jgi:hypothetical protein
MDSRDMSTPTERSAPIVSDFRTHTEPDKVRTARALDQGGAEPVLIRAYCGVRKGATAFVRNRCFLAALAAELGERCLGRPRVFFPACSVGAEPSSFAIWCLHEHEHTGRELPLIVATDIAPAFLSTAQEALYRSGWLRAGARRTTRDPRGMERPSRRGSSPVGAPEYSWQLPPFDTIVPEREYRFGALFARRSGT